MYWIRGLEHTITYFIDKKYGNDIRVEYIKICSILYASFKPKTSIVCEKWHMALKYLQRHTGLLDI